jgi:hypothetical protein
MDETIDHQDPLRAAIAQAKETADNLRAATKAQLQQFQNAVENAWSDPRSLT